MLNIVADFNLSMREALLFTSSCQMNWIGLETGEAWLELHSELGENEKLLFLHVLHHLAHIQQHSLYLLDLLRQTLYFLLGCSKINSLWHLQVA